jgi:hypothetical protein
MACENWGVAVMALEACFFMSIDCSETLYQQLRE